MGKQISFFLLEDEEIRMLSEISSLNTTLLDKKAIELSEEFPSQIFIGFKDSKIIKTDEYISEIFSEVIVFSRTKYLADKETYCGRVWMETKYYNSNGEICKKSIEIEKLFKQIIILIKKMTKKSKCGDYYISDLVKEKALNNEIILKSTPKTKVEI